MLQVTSANILGEGDAQPQSSLLVCLPRQITDKVFGVGGVFSCDWWRNGVRLLKKYVREVIEREDGERARRQWWYACVYVCVCVCVQK